MMKYNVATTEKEARQQILDIMENYTQNTDEMIEYLAFQSRFYQYSARNTMMIYMQNQGAMLCQSFAAWGKEKVDGKSVKILKGQHGMKILVPTTVTTVIFPDGTKKGLFYCTAEEKKKVKSGELESKKRMGFKVGTTFDIAQTDYPSEKYPERLNRGKISADHAECFKALKEYSENTLKIPFFIGDAEEEINGAGLFGFCRYNPNGTKEIHLARNLADTQLISVGGHELGHAILHGGKCEKSTYRKEVEADMFGILLACHFGLEIENTRKNHLSDNFRGLASEVVKGVKSEDVKKVRQKAIADAFNDVNKAYREHIDKIDKLIAE